MNLFDIYFALMGGAPPPRPVPSPELTRRAAASGGHVQDDQLYAKHFVDTTAAGSTTKKAAAPASSPSPVDNAVAAREKTASNKRRGRTSLITNMGGAPGLGDDAAGRKPKLGGY